MPVKAPKALERNNTGIEEVCVKLLQAREIRQQMEEIEDAQKEILKVILEEFPDEKKFSLDQHMITWRTTTTQKPPKFKKSLVDAGVSPEIIKAATEASKEEGSPWLLVERKKE